VTEGSRFSGSRQCRHDVSGRTLRWKKRSVSWSRRDSSVSSLALMNEKSKAWSK